MAEVFYFNHSVAARAHMGIKTIIKQHGIAGYGHFFMLLEQVYATHKPILDLSNPYTLEAAADEHLMEPEELVSFIDDCCSAGLFDSELWQTNRHLTSNGIVEAFNYREAKSKAGQKGGRPRKTDG